MQFDLKFIYFVLTQIFLVTNEIIFVSVALDHQPCRVVQPHPGGKYSLLIG